MWPLPPLTSARRAMSLEVPASTAHIFTVDVEEYFQVHAFERYVPRSQWAALPSRVERGVETLLDLLAAHGAAATFFTLGWVAERLPGLVRRVAEAGHEVASHGWWHRRVPTLTRQQFRDEVRRSREVLEQAGGQRVDGFRAPSFSIGPGTAWAYETLAEEGYRYDSSVFPIRRPGYGHPDAPHRPYVIQCTAGALLEFPMATTEWAGVRLPAAGGGYLRHLPYGLTRRAFREYGADGAPGVLYVHPWEVDPDQPVLPVPWLARVRHYRGLHRTRPRLARLLSEFRFTSVARHLAGAERAPVGSGAPRAR